MPGFDNITYGYCLHQCVTESLLGALIGVSAVVGVLGSLAFPHLRRAINVQRTGFLGFTWLLISLSLCVLAVWLPGSPFEMYAGEEARGGSTKEEAGEICSSAFVLILFSIL